MYFAIFVFLCCFQIFLTTVIIVIPNVFIILFLSWYGTARLMEKKCAFYQNVPWKRKVFDYLVKVFDGLANTNAKCANACINFLHLYEIVGLENIPTDRPVILIFYHGGPMPSDMLYLPIKFFLKTGRVLRTVADRFFFVVPIWTYVVRSFIFSGTPEQCLSTLKKGHSLQIAPGGGFEAFFATRQYEIIWNNRIGFARIAKEAGVDIIPVFTRNIRQMFVMPQIFQSLLKGLYAKTRGPVFFAIGGFPVKLTTYVGELIKFDSVETAEELAEMTQKSLEKMIQKHQTFPATFSSAISERLYGQEKVKDI